MDNINDIELVSEGIRDLLCSKEVESICQKEAARVLNNVGHKGYSMSPRRYAERHGYAVFTKTIEAEKDNEANNTLLKALG